MKFRTGTFRRKPFRLRDAAGALGWACAAISILTLAGCGESASESDLTEIEESAYDGQIPVETLVLRPRNYEEAFFASGVVEAEENITVSAEIAGRVEQADFEVGDEVKRGELLVRLDDASVRARIRKAEAEIARMETLLANARKDLEREQELFRSQAAAERTLDNAQREVDAYASETAGYRADLELLKVELDRTQIRSPVDGTIAEKYAALGEYVTPGTRLFDVVMTDRVDFVFHLGERDVTRVREGDALRIEIDAWPERNFEGAVATIAPAGNERTRTFRVEAAIENPPPHPLKPGMSGRARVVRARHENVLLLPEEAILRDESGSYVYLTNDGHARPEPVEIISASGARAVISGDFPSEHPVIILGQYALNPGTPVFVRREHREIPEFQFD